MAKEVAVILFHVHGFRFVLAFLFVVSRLGRCKSYNDHNDTSRAINDGTYDLFIQEF